MKTRIHLILVICCIIAGCAATPRSEVQPFDLETFKSGQIILQRASDHTNYGWFDFNYSYFRLLDKYNKGTNAETDWLVLAQETYDANTKNQLSYFYLGLAAENLGHSDAAVVYYNNSLGQYEQFVRSRDISDCKQEVSHEKISGICSWVNLSFVTKERILPLSRNDITISSTPTSASIYLNGKYIGRTPLTITERKGTYDITVTTEDDLIDRRVSIKEDIVLSFDFDSKESIKRTIDKFISGHSILRNKLRKNKDNIGLIGGAYDYAQSQKRFANLVKEKSSQYKVSFPVSELNNEANKTRNLSLELSNRAKINARKSINEYISYLNAIEKEEYSEDGPFSNPAKLLFIEPPETNGITINSSSKKFNVIDIDSDEIDTCSTFIIALKITHKTTNFKKTGAQDRESNYLAGSREVLNPDYRRARDDVGEAKRNLDNYVRNNNKSLQGGGKFGALAFAIAQGAGKMKLEERLSDAKDRLYGTPQTITQDTTRDYTLLSTSVRGIKTGEMSAVLLGCESNTFKEFVMKNGDVKYFTLYEGIHPKDTSDLSDNNRREKEEMKGWSDEPFFVNLDDKLLDGAKLITSGKMKNKLVRKDVLRLFFQ